VRAHEIQLGAYRRMSGDERSRIAVELSEMVRESARSGIRMRHPSYDAADVERALRRLLYGDDLVRRAWPHDPLVDP
jgi:hypothetical protein